MNRLAADVDAHCHGSTALGRAGTAAGTRQLAATRTAAAAGTQRLQSSTCRVSHYILCGLAYDIVAHSLPAVHRCPTRR